MSSNNRQRGHAWERSVINDFKKKTKFTEIVSSRYGSRMLDDMGVDIFGLPFNVQIKTLNTKPDILEILKKMPSGQDNLIVVKRTKKTLKGTFRELGRYVVLDYDYYFKLLNKSNEKDVSD